MIRARCMQRSCYPLKNGRRPVTIVSDLSRNVSLHILAGLQRTDIQYSSHLQEPLLHRRGLDLLIIQPYDGAHQWNISNGRLHV